MVQDKVLKILARETSLPASEIELESTLLGDLKIDGDDAWAVLEKCSEQLNLDLSDFNFNDYFRSEPCLKGFLYIYRKLKYRDEHVASQKSKLTVAGLIKACERGSFEKIV
jgi:hypothetical protein